ncbi:MAG: alpha/beta hydrolase [Fuerstiella sp.]|nr:alpha/beta hydrolase [Fuerstiella sp.]
MTRSIVSQFIVAAIIAFSMFTTCVFAADHERVLLWPQAVPGEDRLDSEFVAKVVAAEKKNVPDRVFGVTAPSMTVYPAPAERADGAAVLVCPGGAYNVLAWGHEGSEVAEWLNSIGIHAFVLTYRVPRRKPDFTLPPLQDAQRALRLIRARAHQMRIDNKRIGVLGFSAGGNLAVNVGTRYDEQTYNPVDDADLLSCRPDFMVPVYAAYLGAEGDDRTETLNPALKIDKRTPPAFLVVTQDDKNRGLHSALLFAELTKARVPAEVHVYTKGGHGYGMRPSHNAVSEWPARCADWLLSMGFLQASAPQSGDRSGSDQ